MKIETIIKKLEVGQITKIGSKLRRIKTLIFDG